MAARLERDGLGYIFEFPNCGEQFMAGVPRLRKRTIGH